MGPRPLRSFCLLSTADRLPLASFAEFMAYENYFETRVMDFRMEEVEKLRRNCFFKA